MCAKQRGPTIQEQALKRPRQIKVFGRPHPRATRFVWVASGRMQSLMSSCALCSGMVPDKGTSRVILCLIRPKFSAAGLNSGLLLSTTPAGVRAASASVKDVCLRQVRRTDQSTIPDFLCTRTVAVHPAPGPSSIAWFETAVRLLLPSRLAYVEIMWSRQIQSVTILSLSLLAANATLRKRRNMISIPVASAYWRGALSRSADLHCLPRCIADKRFHPCSCSLSCGWCQ